jgi:prevent-host-death family protein
MTDRVGVRELRQHLSRYLDQVKDGATLVVTERGREVARLVPSGPADAPIARLAATRGATLPQGSLAELRPPSGAPASGPSSSEVLDDLREDRL